MRIGAFILHVSIFHIEIFGEAHLPKNALRYFKVPIREPVYLIRYLAVHKILIFVTYCFY